MVRRKERGREKEIAGSCRDQTKKKSVITSRAHLQKFVHVLGSLCLGLLSSTGVFLFVSKDQATVSDRTIH